MVAVGKIVSVAMAWANLSGRAICNMPRLTIANEFMNTD